MSGSNPQPKKETTSGFVPLLIFVVAILALLLVGFLTS